MKTNKIIVGVAIVATAFLANCSATGTNQTDDPAADASNEDVGIAVNALFSSDQSQSQSALNVEERDPCTDSGGPSGISVGTSVTAGHYGTASDGYDMATTTACSNDLPIKTWQITTAVEMDCEDGNVTFAGGQGVFIDDGSGASTNIYGFFVIGGTNFYCDVVIEHPQGGAEVFTASCEQEQSDGSRSAVSQATTGNSCQSPE